MKKEKILSFLHKYKYYIVLIVFLTNIGVWDENNLIKRYEHQKEISDLKSEISRYKKIYNSDTHKLQVLEKDPDEIKRIARENYFMKMQDEDVYVFSDGE